MQNYLVVNVPDDLLPQVTAELLQFAVDANHVEVVSGAVGRVIHVHPLVADAWIEWRKAKEEGEAQPKQAPPEESAPPAPPEPMLPPLTQTARSSR